ncbi:MAG: hypothetical protein A4E63_00667 [Syntrophorhabdus sp. PtaU1.Bin050]|nr:MAG: hypothetical protein A4E63_00667 [Syntrophorhabdus sp. PtaU1.Bin050]
MQRGDDSPCTVASVEKGLLLFDNSRLMCYEKAVKVELEGKIYDVEKPMQVSRLLQQFSLSRETHLVVVNNRLVTEDYRLGKDDQIKLIRVVSGG